MLDNQDIPGWKSLTERIGLVLCFFPELIKRNGIFSAISDIPGSTLKFHMKIRELRPCRFESAWQGKILKISNCPLVTVVLSQNW